MNKEDIKTQKQIMNSAFLIILILKKNMNNCSSHTFTGIINEDKLF